MAKYPDNKISHTILEFGKHLIEQLPEPHNKTELEACMKLVVLVWNSVTLDTIQETKANTEVLLETLKNEPADYVLLVKRLVIRKKRHFGLDLRGVGNTWIKERNGELVFGCDARAMAG